MVYMGCELGAGFSSCEDLEAPSFPYSYCFYNKSILSDALLTQQHYAAFTLLLKTPQQENADSLGL